MQVSRYILAALLRSRDVRGGSSRWMADRWRQGHGRAALSITYKQRSPTAPAPEPPRALPGRPRPVRRPLDLADFHVSDSHTIRCLYLQHTINNSTGPQVPRPRTIQTFRIRHQYRLSVNIRKAFRRSTLDKRSREINVQFVLFPNSSYYFLTENHPLSLYTQK